MNQEVQKYTNQLLVWPRHLKSAKISCWYDPRSKKVQKLVVGMAEAVNTKISCWYDPCSKCIAKLADCGWKTAGNTGSCNVINTLTKLHFTYLGLEVSRSIFLLAYPPTFHYVCPLIHRSTTFLSFCLHAHLFVRLPICPYICLPACLSICVSVYLSVCQPISLSLYLFVCLYICLSISLSISLSVSLPTLSPTCLPFDLYVCLSI